MPLVGLISRVIRQRSQGAVPHRLHEQRQRYGPAFQLLFEQAERLPSVLSELQRRVVHVRVFVLLLFVVVMHFSTLHLLILYFALARFPS